MRAAIVSLGDRRLVDSGRSSRGATSRSGHGGLQMHRPRLLSVRCSKPPLAACQRTYTHQAVVTPRRSRSRRCAPRGPCVIQSFGARDAGVRLACINLQGLGHDVARREALTSCESFGARDAGVRLACINLEGLGHDVARRVDLASCESLGSARFAPASHRPISLEGADRDVARRVDLASCESLGSLRGGLTLACINATACRRRGRRNRTTLQTVVELLISHPARVLTRVFLRTAG